MSIPRPMFTLKDISKALWYNDTHNINHHFMSHTAVHGTSIIYTNYISVFQNTENHWLFKLKQQFMAHLQK